MNRSLSVLVSSGYHDVDQAGGDTNHQQDQVIPKVTAFRGTNFLEREDGEQCRGYCVRESPDEEENTNH